jgi:hypothetical protein
MGSSYLGPGRDVTFTRVDLRLLHRLLWDAPSTLLHYGVTHGHDAYAVETMLEGGLRRLVAFLCVLLENADAKGTQCGSAHAYPALDDPLASSRSAGRAGEHEVMK